VKYREFAYCGLFGATALLLPVIFHLLHLGHIFMPMYLPLVTLAFFVSPRLSALTAFLVPVLSGIATGMPPFYPPVAPVMALELAIMSLIIGIVHASLPRVHTLLILLPVLMVGRVLNLGLMYLAAQFVNLPGKFIAGLSLLSGWPGIVLMMVVIPPVVRLSKIHSRPAREFCTRGNTNTSNPRTDFFDSIADKWDTWHDLKDQGNKLGAILDEFGVNAGEHVLDIGCGTGNLTMALLPRIGTSGKIVAVDISSRMLARAKGKISDSCIMWHHGSAEKLPIDNGKIDRVLCFSIWPHFDNPEEIVKEFHRVLRPGGSLHIFHLISREQVNRIHSQANPSVRNDTLVHATETANLLTRNGFIVCSTRDDEERYVITARKNGILP